MIKIFTDSGSSIKPNESEALGVRVIPLMILLNGKEYRDGEELSTEEFYRKLIDEKLFPKTSLPSLAECEEKVRACTEPNALPFRLNNTGTMRPPDDHQTQATYGPETITNHDRDRRHHRSRRAVQVNERLRERRQMERNRRFLPASLAG